MTKKIQGIIFLLSAMIGVSMTHGTPTMQEKPPIPAFQTVIDFWFNELEPKQWWMKDPAFDRMFSTRFGDLHKAAAAGELSSFRDTPEGRLAEIILLDQGSRNIHRDTPLAFACDGMALVLAQEAVRRHALDSLSPNQRLFLLMPYMHSESLLIHEQGLALFKKYHLDTDYEMRHKVIIERFGRYPHRNAILGRPSTPEEVEFLKQPGSSF